MSLEPWAASIAVTGHVLPDIRFMVSPSRITVIVICSVLTHEGPHTTHALSVCSFLRSSSACVIVQIRPRSTVPSVLFLLVLRFLVIFSMSTVFLTKVENVQKVFKV